MVIEIRPLRPEDDRTAFRSGDHDLDRFFAKYAGQSQFRHHTGTTYVALEADRIVGYASVATGNIEAEALPAAARRGLPRYPLPILRLARLATDETARGRGIGSALTQHVFSLALRMSEQYGCVGILVDAKSDATEFYARLGFSRLDATEGEIESRPKPTLMFIPLALVATAVGVETRGS